MATKTRKPMSSKPRATQSKNRTQQGAKKAKFKAAQKTTSTRKRIWDYIKKNKLQDSAKKR
jgi:hypothetical protein